MKPIGWIVKLQDGNLAQDSYGNILVYKTKDEALSLGRLNPVVGLTALSKESLTRVLRFASLLRGERDGGNESMHTLKVKFVAHARLEGVER